MSTLISKNLTIPGAKLDDENPFPIFRDPEMDVQVQLHKSITPNIRKYFGWRAKRRVLPYRMQDRYNREKNSIHFRAIILENEYLKATFLPEVGGRLISLIYKPLEKELLYRNPVYQPANLALRDAWFAGGVEWNVGQTGHWFLTNSAVFAAAIQGPQGEPGLRMYEFERCKNLFWHTDFYLPPNFPFLVAFTRVLNLGDEETAMYWWTNIAVPEAPDVRVLSPANEAVYLDRGFKGFGLADMPNLPSLPDQDPTYSTNWPHASEFFMQCQKAAIPWVAALDAKGSGLIEASTQRLNVRKLFCWGMSQGGRHWQDFLAEPGHAYIEIQAGLAPTQLHNLPMSPGSEWYWTEVFGHVQADPADVHNPDWKMASKSVEKVLKSQLTVENLAELEQQCRVQAEEPSSVIIQEGSGWGALEDIRRTQMNNLTPIPATFNFPESTLGTEQKKWLRLLNDGQLPELDPSSPPGEWMTQKEWHNLLENSLVDPGNRNWYALLHYGVMLAEQFDEGRAILAWQESLKLKPSIWGYRNLGALARRNDDLAKAMTYYEQAWELAVQANIVLEVLACEFLSIMIEAEKYAEAWSFCESLPANVLDYDRIQILSARAALQLGKLDIVEQIISGEFTSVREGAVGLTNLWLEMWRRRIAAQTERSLEEVSLEEVEKSHPAPLRIDFRSS